MKTPIITPGNSPGAANDNLAVEGPGEVMDVAEVAAFLRVGRQVVYDLSARAQIPHRRVGKHLRFSRQAIVRWLSSCGPQGAKEGH